MIIKDNLSPRGRELKMVQINCEASKCESRLMTSEEMKKYGVKDPGKRCPRCGNVQPTTQFYRDLKGKLSSYCKKCKSKYNYERSIKKAKMSEAMKGE